MKLVPVFHFFLGGGVQININCFWRLWLDVWQTMTGKIAHKVELCPRTTKDWLRASKRLNCTNDYSNPVNRYHCLPADDLSTLVEFCYKETRPRVSKGILHILLNGLLFSYQIEIQQIKQWNLRWNIQGD